MDFRTCENKFWRNPNLVLHLLPFLDVASTLALASAHPLSCDLLGRSSTWKKFLERGRVTQERLVACTSVEEYCDEMLEMGEELEKVHSVLLLLDPDENGRPDLELEVLKSICQRFPSRTPSREFVNNSIKLRFHKESTEGCPTYFSVSSEGLHLIQLLDSSEHFAVVDVHMDSLLHVDNFANTIGEVADLQKNPIRRLEAKQFNLESKSLALLVNHCQTWQVRVLSISEHLSPEDWSGLAKRIRETKPEDSRFDFLSFEDPESCGKASREDLRVIWAAAKYGWLYKMREGDSIEEGVAMMVNAGLGEV